MSHDQMHYSCMCVWAHKCQSAVLACVFMRTAVHTTTYRAATESTISFLTHRQLTCNSGSCFHVSMDVKLIVAMHRCPPSSRDPVMEQLDEENHDDIHDEWLGRPEVRRQMREVCLSLMTDAVACMLQMC